MALITLGANSGKGKVLQVIQTHLITTSSQSITDEAITNITGLNATITPSSTSNKIKITCRWNGEISTGNNESLLYGIRRDSTVIGNQTSIGSRMGGIQSICQGYFGADGDSTMDSAMWQYIDSPSSTSAITYHGTFLYGTGSGHTLYNQRTEADNNDENHERATSTIILEEIVG